MIFIIGERLTELRKDAGLTQNQLGKLLNIDKGTISSYETNKREAPDEIKKIFAKFFNVSVDYLLGLTDEPYPPYSGVNGQYLRLPDRLPAEMRKDVKEFAEYMAYKAEKEKQKNG